MKFSRKTVQFGGSVGITLPSELLIYLDIPKGTQVIVEDRLDDNGEPYAILRRDSDGNTETIE